MGTLRNDATVIALVDRASKGDGEAWDELVQRYVPLVWGVCRRYRLSDADARDVGQNVWLRLVEHISTIREPAALPGWLATTTRRECLRVCRASSERQQREDKADLGDVADPESAQVDKWLIAEERATALRIGFGQLPSHCRQLLSLLLQDPPVPYSEISTILNMPVGGIGPNRARCLDRLRRCPAIVALIEESTQADGRGEGHDRPMVEQRRRAHDRSRRRAPGRA
jgi:RNA polymerase sigma factor (sigma-70 family)